MPYCMGPCHVLASVAISIALALTAVSTTRRHNGGATAPLFHPVPLTDQLMLNASAALRKSGYSIMATTLQISAAQILARLPATLFAIHDPALVNLTLPPWLMLDLLRYHTATDKLPWQTLRSLPAGTCLPTLLHARPLLLTAAAATVELNGVAVVQPDIFVAAPLAIHGVHAPFYDFEPRNPQPPLACGRRRHAPSPPPSGAANFSGLLPKLLAALRSKGYLSFSMAVQLQWRELDAGLAAANATGVTVFAPADRSFAYVAVASPVLGQMMRLHVATRRLAFADLVRRPVKSKIPTALPGCHLEITSPYEDEFHPLVVSGVPVIPPDVFSAAEFVVHGILRPFDVLNVTAAT